MEKRYWILLAHTVPVPALPSIVEFGELMFVLMRPTTPLRTKNESPVAAPPVWTASGPRTRTRPDARERRRVETEMERAAPHASNLRAAKARRQLGEYFLKYEYYYE